MAGDTGITATSLFGVMAGGPVRSSASAKAWDFELPASAVELARYWDEKARVAEDQAALCVGTETVAWRNMAEAWRQAAQKAAPAFAHRQATGADDASLENDAGLSADQ